jgi:iron complex transport system substrate-binding protein
MIYMTLITRKSFGVVCLILCTLFIPLTTTARTVSDQIGREMAVPEDPQRIVTLAASLTEIVYALGQGHRVCGVEQFSDYPPAAQTLPKVGSYINPDVERIVALRPDLCLAIKDGNPRHVVERLVGLGIPVYVVDPRNLKGVIATIQEIGRLINAVPAAEALADDLSRRLQRINFLVTRHQHRPRIFLQIGIFPIVSAGSHTFLNELITTAGGLNVAAGKITYPKFSREQVLALQPEIMIITSMARGEAFDRVKAFWEQWQTLPAARNHKIFLVDSNIVDRPSPRIFDGLETLFRLFHPELSGELP